MTKRALDWMFAGVGLVATLPLWILIAAAVKLDSPGPVFFQHRRIGRGFRPFDVYKFRTMGHGARGASITFGGARDRRITRVGALLRDTKLDELPQLINVMRGEMSLVGPRPEVQEYVELFRPDFEEILTVRPGLTDFASLAYHDEGALLAAAADPAGEYARHILPAKIALAKEYVRRASLRVDVMLIAATARQVLKSAGGRLGLPRRRVHA